MKVRVKAPGSISSAPFSLSFTFPLTFTLPLPPCRKYS